MKTKNNIFVMALLVLVTLFASINAKAQTLINFSSLPFTQANQMQYSCQGQLATILVLKTENFYSDSTLIGSLWFQTQSNPFTTADSLFILKNGVIFSQAKFFTNQAILNVNKWIPGNSKDTFTIVCKTILGTSGWLNVQLNQIKYTLANSNYDNSIWPSIYGVNYQISNCSQIQLPDFYPDYKSNNQFCIEDSSPVLTVSVHNNNLLDSMKIKGLVISSSFNSSGTVDSISVIFKGMFIGKYKTINSKVMFNNINKYLQPNESANFDIICKNSTLGGFTVSMDSVYWSCKNTDSLSSIKIAASAYTYSCNPEVEINFNSNGNINGSTVCQKDWNNFSVYVNSQSPIDKEEFFVNGVLKNRDSLIIKGQNPDYMKINFIYPKTKLVVKVTDVTGRIGYDSLSFDVLLNPIPKIVASSSTICTGSSVVIECKDTTNISAWAWNWSNTSPNKPLQMFAFTTGDYSFQVVGKNGCTADTMIFLSQVPAQPTPTILQNDWILTSTVQADSFAWFGGITNPPSFLSNSNKISTDGTNAGYYKIKAFSKGCSAESAIIHTNGWIAPDTMPHVRLTISSPRIGLSVCSKDSVTAMRQIKISNGSTVTSEQWFINGNIIPLAPSQISDAMTYKIPLTSSNTKLLVKITDNFGHISKDSVILNVLPSPTMRLTVTNSNFCSGSSALAALDTTGLAGWSWNWSNNLSKSNLVNLPILTSGDQNVKILSSNGCTADTMFTTNMLPAQEKLTILSHDSLLWTNSSAYSLQWYKDGNPIANSNKQYMSIVNHGFIKVEATNIYGCKSTSDPIIFYYTAPVNPIDSTRIKITTSDVLNNGKFCSGEFHPNLQLIGINFYDVQTVTWTVNGIIKYGCYLGLCQISPQSIFLNWGQNTIVATITTIYGKVKTDTVRFDVVNAAKTKMIDKTLPPYCSTRELTFAVEGGSDLFSSANWSLTNSKTYSTVFKNISGDVYCKTTDNNGCISYSDTVHVKQIEITKPLIASSKCELYADAGDQIVNQFKWYEGKDLIDSTIASKTTIHNTGFYKVQYTTTDGCISEISNPVFAECSATGTSELNNENHLIVYPNPFTDRLNIESEIGSKFVFININGQIVYEGLAKDQHTELSIDVPPGIYILQITDGEKVNRQKIVRE